MDTILENAFALKKHHEYMIYIFEKKLESLPEGRLSQHIIRGKARYYRFFKKSETVYLSQKKDVPLIHDLAQKRFILNSLSTLNRNLKSLETLIASYQPWDPSSCANSLPITASELLHGLESPIITADIIQWQADSFDANPLFPEKKIHLTCRGDYVRSKSELSIADCLYTHGIPYKYEAPLTLNNTTYYPDFQILRRRDSKLLYWEHFGMMGNSQYERNADEKLKIYRENGICQWDNLIVTYDTPDGALDMRQVTAVIKAFLI